MYCSDQMVLICFLFQIAPLRSCKENSPNFDIFVEVGQLQQGYSQVQYMQSADVETRYLSFSWLRSFAFGRKILLEQTTLIICQDGLPYVHSSLLRSIPISIIAKGIVDSVYINNFIKLEETVMWITFIQFLQYFDI